MTILWPGPSWDPAGEVRSLDCASGPGGAGKKEQTLGLARSINFA